MKSLKPGNKTAVFVDTDCTLYVDVDETLVLTKYPADMAEDTILLNKFGHPLRVLPHWAHADAIRQFKARGHAVVVWSAGGAKWARSVVEALKLQHSVDVIIKKPDWIIDDKPCDSWMGKRFYWALDGTVLVDDRDKKEEEK